MRRILASLIAVFVCLMASGQAFTPRRPFIPATASQGPALDIPIRYWWVSSDIPNGWTVTNWTDRIQGKTWDQSVSALRPTNSTTGVYFDGSSSILTNRPNIAVAADVGNNIGGWFVIVRPMSSAIDLQGILGTGSIADDGNLGGYGLCLRSSGDWGYFGSQGSGTVGKYVVGSTMDFCVSWTNVSPFTDAFYTNGVLSTTANDASPNNYWGWAGGGSGGMVNYMGYITEIIMFSNSVSPANVTALHLYATNTYPVLYGLWNVPVIAVQPASVVCLTNTIQSFTLTVSAVPTATYQWRTNGVNVSETSKWSGVNTSTLWVTNDGVLYSELMVDCVVANIVGGVTSTVATLNTLTNLGIVGGALSVYDVSTWTYSSPLTGTLNGSDMLGNFDLRSDNSPTWTGTPTINGGKRRVHFVEASVQRLSTNYTATFPQPTTIWLVASNGAVPSSLVFFDNNDATVYQVYFTTVSQIGIDAGTTRLDGSMPSRWRVWEFYFNGASSYVKTNGVALLSAGDAGANGRKGLSIGTSRTGTQASTFDLAFMGIYTNTLSAGDSAVLYQYLTNKFTNAIAP